MSELVCCPQAFTLQVKKAAISASLERAAVNRARTLSAVQEAAAFFNTHVKDVAESVKIEASRAGQEETKATMYRKLVAADVSRSLALRAKVEVSSASAAVLSQRTPKPTCHPEVIHIPVGDANSCLKAPPEALLRRLSLRPRTLLATSRARQLGAFTRREIVGTGWHQKSVLRIGRVARAAGKRAAARAEMLSKLEAREARANLMSNLKAKQRKRIKARNAALATLVEANGVAMEEQRALCGVAAAVRCENAAERRSKIVRTMAKRGVPAVRAAAAASRRSSLQATKIARGHYCALRSLAAGASRAEALEKVIATAVRLEGSPRSVHWSHAVTVE